MITEINHEQNTWPLFFSLIALYQLIFKPLHIQLTFYITGTIYKSFYTFSSQEAALLSLMTSISAYGHPAVTCPPSSSMYCSSLPAEGERSTVGSLSFSNTHVLLPTVIRYLQRDIKSNKNQKSKPPGNSKTML